MPNESDHPNADRDVELARLLGSNVEVGEVERVDGELLVSGIVVVDRGRGQLRERYRVYLL